MTAILQKKGTFLYPGTKYGGENPLTIHRGLFCGVAIRESEALVSMK